MTELVVTLLKLRVRDPNWDALHFLEHTLVDAAFEIILERVGMGTKGSDPELPPDPRSHAANGIVQSAVGMGVRLGMPGSVADKRVILSPAIRR